MGGERLTRDLDEAMLGGVLAGVARRYDIDVTVLRLLAVIAILPTGGIAIPVYLAAWLIIPRPDQVGPVAGEPRPLRDRLRRDRVGSAAREASDTARRAADRISDAARLASEAARIAGDAARAAADAARTATEEISDIAHQPQPDAAPVEPGDAPSRASEAAAESAPPDAPSRPVDGPPATGFPSA